MHWQTMFKGNYITAVEFGDKVPTLTIADVRMVKLEQDDGRQKDKGVIFFSETERGWVLCKTNAMCLAAMFGDDTSAWVGKRVTLVSQMVNVGREKKPGIRVKGSPDIKGNVNAEIKLPRKKPFAMQLVPTSVSKATHSAPPMPPPDGDAGGFDDSAPGERPA
jgi:hypothetical protein